MAGRARPFAAADARAYPALIGVDEVGRGALCGPVVAAAVWFDPRAVPPALMAALDDSKKLTRAAREAAAPMIAAAARWALAASPVAEVDALGVGRATLAAMRRAVARLGVDAPLRVDGRAAPPDLAPGFAPGLDPDIVAVVGGDGLVPQIAAASILAKVARDRLMRGLAPRYPGYGWESNVGYGAARHMAALRAQGVTPHHRRSFAPVAAHVKWAAQQPGREPPR